MSYLEQIGEYEGIDAGGKIPELEDGIRGLQSLLLLLHGGGFTEERRRDLPEPLWVNRGAMLRSAAASRVLQPHAEQYAEVMALCALMGALNGR